MAIYYEAKMFGAATIMEIYMENLKLARFDALSVRVCHIDQSG